MDLESLFEVGNFLVGCGYAWETSALFWIRERSMEIKHFLGLGFFSSCVRFENVSVEVNHVWLL